MLIASCGGSRRLDGSQILGGSTVKSSMNSSMPSSKSCLVLALYATSQNTCHAHNDEEAIFTGFYSANTMYMLSIAKFMAYFTCNDT